MRHLWGTLAAQKGDLDTAETHYLAALATRERIGDRAGMASLLSNLAIVAEYRQDYSAAQELGEQALGLRLAVGDRWGMGISHNNLGMLAVLQQRPEQAKERFAQSLALHTEVGDTWMVALGQHNLGNAHRDLGEDADARRCWGAALQEYRRNADGWALASLYEDAAMLLAARDAPADALRLVGAADALRAEIGSPRGRDVEDRLDAVLAGVHTERAADAQSWLAQGRALGETADQIVIAEPSGPAQVAKRI